MLRNNEYSEKAFIEERMPEKTFNLLHLAAWAIFAVYFVNIAIGNSQWSFLDNVNLPMHEAGHAIFMIFGNDFLMIAGGTLVELLIPLIFIIYFYATNQKFSASLVMLWMGETIISVSMYMGDAIDMALPLITGDTSGHDWHNMFSMLGLLPMTHSFAGATRLVGVFVILYGLVWGLRCCRRKKHLLLLD